MGAARALPVVDAKSADPGLGAFSSRPTPAPRAGRTIPPPVGRGRLCGSAGRQRKVALQRRMLDARGDQQTFQMLEMIHKAPCLHQSIGPYEHSVRRGGDLVPLGDVLRDDVGDILDRVPADIVGVTISARALS